MTNRKARHAVTALLRGMHLALVVWHRHFGEPLVVLVNDEMSPVEPGLAYSALYEEYWDKGYGDGEKLRLRLPETQRNWNGLHRKLRELGFVA